MLRLPELDDRVFEDLVDELKKLIGVYGPAWTDHNLHDPGVTLAELFCWLTEMLEFYLNDVGDRNILKYLKLLNASPRSACCARGWVSVARPSGAENPLMLLKGVRVNAGETVFETENPLWVYPLRLTKVITATAEANTDNTSKLDADGFYPLGEAPEPGNTLTLLFSAAVEPFKLKAGKPLSLYLRFETRKRSGIARAGDVLWDVYDHKLKNWQPMTVVNDETQGFCQSGRITLLNAPTAKRPADAAPGAGFAVRARASSRQNHPKLRSIEVNTVPVMQKRTVCGFQELWWPGVGQKAHIDEYGHMERNKVYFMQYRMPGGYWKDFARTMYLVSFKQNATAVVTVRNITIPVADERGVRLRLTSFYKRLPVFAATGFPCQTIRLPWAHVLPEGFHVMIRERIVSQDKVSYEWFDWERVDDFDASGPSDRHYMLDADKGLIHFGDGIKGAVPKHIKKFPRNIRVVSCSVCEGAAGNLQEGMINSSEEALLPADAAVNNFTGTEGGLDPESIPAAVGRMRSEILMTPAVTLADYEKLALKTPGMDVARVKAVPFYVPEAHADGCPEGAHETAVSLVVVPFADKRLPAATEPFLRAVDRHLSPSRLLTTQLYVIAPEYVYVSVQADVRFRAGFTPDINRVSEALNAFLSPLGNGKDYEGWRFGRTVYISEINRKLKTIEGVDFVRNVTLRARGEGFLRYRNGNVEISPVSLIQGERHMIGIV